VHQIVLLVATLVSADPTLYGCYESVNRSMYPDLARLYFRDQYRHGMRNGTVSGNTCHAFGPNQVIGLARQVDMMVEEGIATPGAPMLALSLDPKDIAASKASARYPARWPELVCGNVDEPNPTLIGAVRANGSAAWAAGVRSGTAIAGYNLYLDPESVKYDGHLADWLDMWIVLASTWQPDLRRKALEATADLCAYWAYPREPDRDRYVAGLWCWKTNPKVFYYWAYTHDPNTGILPNGVKQHAKDDEFSFVYPSPTGPVSTPAWEAAAEGIRDHELLDRLAAQGGSEAWLSELADSLPTVCPVPPKPVPFTDWKRLRRECLRRLHG
jgi:hypothetical protein